MGVCLEAVVVEVVGFIFIGPTLQLVRTLCHLQLAEASLLHGEEQAVRADLKVKAVLSLASHVHEVSMVFFVRNVRLEHIKTRRAQQSTCASLVLLSNFHIGLCTHMFEVV